MDERIEKEGHFYSMTNVHLAFVCVPNRPLFVRVDDGIRAQLNVMPEKEQKSDTTVNFQLCGTLRNGIAK